MKLENVKVGESYMVKDLDYAQLEDLEDGRKPYPCNVGKVVQVKSIGEYRDNEVRVPSPDEVLFDFIHVKYLRKLKKGKIKGTLTIDELHEKGE